VFNIGNIITITLIPNCNGNSVDAAYTIYEYKFNHLYEIIS